MKIAHITTALPTKFLIENNLPCFDKNKFIGGGADYVLELCQALSKKTKVKIIYPANKDFNKKIKNIEICGVKSNINYPYNQLNPYPCINQNLLEDCEAVHIHQYKKYHSMAFAYQAYLIGIPIFLSDLGSTDQALPYLDKVSKILSISNFSSREFSNIPSATIYGGVDTKKFKPLKTFKSNKDINLFYAASIKQHKKQEDLIKAFKILSVKYPNLKLVFSGGIRQDFYFDHLQKLIPAKLKNSIKFMGYTDETTLLKLFQECDIFVSPSTHELFGLSIAQAMSCGKPVVAAGVGSVPELIIHGKSGLLVPATIWNRNKKCGVRSVNTLAKSINTLIEDKNLRNKIGNNARKRIEKYFTWDRVAQKCINHYRNATNEKC